MPLTVEQGFQALLGRLNLTDHQQQVAAGRVLGLQDFFDTTFQLAERPFPVGSYARGTLCAPERDIDLLAPLEPYGPTAYWSRYQADSSAFLYWVRNHLNDHYHSTSVSSRQVSVKLDFTVIVTDVTPCFPLTTGGYFMPDGNRRWMMTNPPFHAQMMVTADAALGFRLKPLVRLIKAWNFANGQHLRSFHIELMVEAIKRGHYIGSWPQEVAVVLKYMPSWLANAFPDPWASGGKIDAYLSANKRRQVIEILQRDIADAKRAEQYRQVGNVRAAFERWNIVYGRTFPAYA